MTALLTIETSTPACSVALQLRDRQISRYSEEPRSHTRLIMGMVSEVLEEAGILVSQLDSIGVSVGPGSFTGLRIGFATVQGLAFAKDTPVVAVSSLQAMAATFLRKHRQLPLGSKIVSVLDARMGEFNCGCYQVGEESTEGIVPDQLLSAEQALGFIELHQPEVIIGEAEVLLDSQVNWLARYTAVLPDALDLLPITGRAFADGLAQPIESIELVYLRGTEAWQKRKRLRES